MQLTSWVPPQQVKVTLMYEDDEAVELWTTESVNQNAIPWARVFLACGPAGQRVRKINRAVVDGLPPKSYVILCTKVDQLGQVVFAKPTCMLN